MLGTAGDSRSNEQGGNELSDHAQEQTNAYRSHEHATCQARRDLTDTSVADDADGRKGNGGSGTEKATDPDGSGPRRESENNAPGIAAEAAGCPKYRALVSGVDFPIKVPKVRHPLDRQAVFVRFALDVHFHQMPGEPFTGALGLGTVCKGAVYAQRAIDGQDIHRISQGGSGARIGKAQCPISFRENT
jgi:hypothetical protein